MKFSIIVPVYQVEKYIDKCIASIKNQDHKNFECIVVDDGSLDRSIDIAKQIVGDDERFHFIHKQNGGLSDARNTGLNAVRGDYIWFIDSDDFIEINSLSLLDKHIQKHASDIICFDMVYLHPDCRTSISKGADFELSSFQANKSIINIDNSANSKIFKSSFLKGKYFPKGMWYEDMAVISSWLIEANEVSYLNHAIYYYLQRAGSITQSADMRVFDIYKAINMIQKTAKDMGYEVEDLIKQRYIDDGLIMTTLRIKSYQNRKNRLQYYAMNMKKLKENYPNWYLEVRKMKKYSSRQQFIFTLLKFKLYLFVDMMYNGL